MRGTVWRPIAPLYAPVPDRPRTWGGRVLGDLCAVTVRWLIACEFMHTHILITVNEPHSALGHNTWIPNSSG
jgi:hypothetical protein